MKLIWLRTHDAAVRTVAGSNRVPPQVDDSVWYTVWFKFGKNMLPVYLKRTNAWAGQLYLLDKLYNYSIFIKKILKQQNL